MSPDTMPDWLRPVPRLDWREGPLIDGLAILPEGRFMRVADVVAAAPAQRVVDQADLTALRTAAAQAVTAFRAWDQTADVALDMDTIDALHALGRVLDEMEGRRGLPDRLKKAGVEASEPSDLEPPSTLHEHQAASGFRVMTPPPDLTALRAELAPHLQPEDGRERTPEELRQFMLGVVHGWTKAQRHDLTALRAAVKRFEQAKGGSVGAQSAYARPLIQPILDAARDLVKEQP